MAVLDTAFLLYLIILRGIKKSYELRFFSEGIVDMLLSLLFLACAFILLFSTGYNSPGLVFGTLISYISLMILIIAYAVYCSKSNALQRIQNTEPKKYSLLSGALIPFSGVIGMVAAKVIFKAIDFENQVAIYICFAISAIISFLFAFGYTNYIKYYYCKKYKILCDKDGNTTSPNLEPAKKLKGKYKGGNTTSPNLEYRKKQKRDKAERSEISLEKPGISKKKRTKKNKHLWVKILIAILAIPVVFILVVFLVFFIKGFIKGLS